MTGRSCVKKSQTYATHSLFLLTNQENFDVGNTVTFKIFSL